MNFEYLEQGDSAVTEKILRSLPDWFGIEESTMAYIEKSKELPMVVAYEDEIPVGFISVKQHSPYTSELYVMGKEFTCFTGNIKNELRRRKSHCFSII
ncbi:hypothetical protein OAQ84_01525 [Bdellovibrionales bacterium]|nr:hypothetical protein [Bdellovibrionales bacterium]